MASILKVRGRWRALIRRRGVNRCRTFDTKGAAQTWARRTESEIEASSTGGHAPTGGLTVGELVKRYSVEMRPAKPWGRHKDLCLERLVEGLGERRLSNLTSGHVIDYARARAAQARATRGQPGDVAINGELSYLAGVLKVARLGWRLDVRPDLVAEARQGLKALNIGRRSQERDRRPTASELDRLRAHFKGSVSRVPMSDVIDFAVLTAMRRSEITRIAWADLDLDKRMVLVRQRKHPDADKKHDDWVPLLNGALEIALRQPRTQARIFPLNAWTVGTYFARACTALGIEDLHLHDLRHEGISRLFESGYSLPEVALVSGHRDWNQLARYTTLRPEALHRD